MATWVRTDEERKVTAAQQDRAEGLHRVRQTLNGPVLTFDGISLYLWDGGENVIKRDDQSIARERRERRTRTL